MMDYRGRNDEKKYDVNQVLLRITILITGVLNAGLNNKDKWIALAGELLEKKLHIYYSNEDIERMLINKYFTFAHVFYKDGGVNSKRIAKVGKIAILFSRLGLALYLAKNDELVLKDVLLNCVYGLSNQSRGDLDKDIYYDLKQEIRVHYYSDEIICELQSKLKGLAVEIERALAILKQFFETNERMDCLNDWYAFAEGLNSKRYGVGKPEKISVTNNICKGTRNNVKHFSIDDQSKNVLDAQLKIDELNKKIEAYEEENRILKDEIDVLQSKQDDIDGFIRKIDADFLLGKLYRIAYKEDECNDIDVIKHTLDKLFMNLRKAEVRPYQYKNLDVAITVEEDDKKKYRVYDSNIEIGKQAIIYYPGFKYNDKNIKGIEPTIRKKED